MKRFILSFLLIGTIIITVKAQSFDKRDIALCYYNVNIDNSLGVIPNKAIADSIYKGMNAVLTESAGIQLKNVDFLKDKVTYLLGYPIGRAKIAAKSKMCHNYVKIQVKITPDGSFTTNESPLNVFVVGKENKKVNARIKVDIQMIIYDENGKKVKEAEAKAVSNEKITIDSESFLIGNFSFINKKQNKANFETFQNILYEAAIKLASSL